MTDLRPENSRSSILERIPKWAAFLSGLSVLVITIMITFDVLMRYFLNEPQLFVDELASLILILIIFGGIAYTFQRAGHIRVDLITNLLARRANRALRISTLMLGIIFLGIITQNTLLSAIVAYRLDRLSMVMFYPLWIPMLLIPMGTGLMALVMVIALIAEVKAPGKNKGMESSGDSGRGVN
jgi:TRAP-type C4-dicarboxylate transport system permease small subunit